MFYRDVVDLWSLARVEIAGLKGGDNGVRVKALGANMDPSCAVILWSAGVEVGVIGNVGGQPPAVQGQQVAHVPGLAPVVFKSNGLIVNLYRMSCFQRQGIVDRQAVPGGMRYADECAGGRSSRGKFRAGLIRSRRRKIQRQTRGKNMPIFAVLKAWGVELGTKYCSETVRAKLAGVSDWKPVALPEVVCDGQKVVAMIPIGGHDLSRRTPSVGSGGMRVDIASKEAPWLIERQSWHRKSTSLRRGWRESR